ncbi:regulatory protein RecX [Sinomicrobium soli]|uniref:regulatory protein RecX n=1 Tax=Sinomicrobium sp. N-1-3-6 TaxID=2219864 RepID=UPI000DCC15B5|nr:regulatory protein RecX [Sinomicrobium sp. N-1-3-6]RAV28353.1 recombinase RecX [Sinomicrobium sp. N-1-3-6]
MNRKIHTVDDAKRKLEHFCAYQERCHKEVTEKLRAMGMIPVAVDAVVVHLIENGFLNEERFARSFVRGKFRVKKWGKQRIVRELKFRDISQSNIKLALEEIEDADYLRAFDELAAKKWLQLRHSTPGNTAKDISRCRKKLADYLLYRGWESHLVYDRLYELS